MARARQQLIAILVVTFLAFSVLVPSGSHAVSVIYVAAAATGAKTGDSWANAHTELQAALAVATAGSELWVARGTYTPTTGTDRTVSFALKRGIVIFGGFAGTERTRSERNWAANVTTLSGDLLQNDGPNVTTRADNSYNVVTGLGTDVTAILDGVAIRGGYADGECGLHCAGGGMNLGGDMFTQAGSPTLTNITFSDNTAVGGGGLNIGMGSTTTLTNVTFLRNVAHEYGGGISSYRAYPKLTNVIFAGNAAATGGGMHNHDSSPTLTNVTFAGNLATLNGGGMDNHYSYPTLTNVTIAGNNAAQGGGMYNLGGVPKIYNSIIWDNSDGIVSADNSGTDIQYSNVQGMTPYPGTHGLSIDPLFVVPLNHSMAPTTTGDLRLHASSPVIDAGNSNFLPAGVVTDLDGHSRVFGRAVDLGAYEAAVTRPVFNIYLPFVPTCRPEQCLGVRLTSTLTGTMSTIMPGSPYLFIQLTDVTDPAGHQFDRYNVFVAPDTPVSEQRNGQPQPITHEELIQRGNGRRVQVLFTGPVLTSYPPGVHALELLLLDH